MKRARSWSALILLLVVGLVVVFFVTPLPQPPPPNATRAEKGPRTSPEPGLLPSTVTRPGASPNANGQQPDPTRDILRGRVGDAATGSGISEAVVALCSDERSEAEAGVESTLSWLSGKVQVRSRPISLAVTNILRRLGTAESATRTGRDGDFALPLGSRPRRTLVISAEGYGSRSLRVADLGNFVEVRLSRARTVRGTVLTSGAELPDGSGIVFASEDTSEISYLSIGSGGSFFGEVPTGSVVPCLLAVGFLLEWPVVAIAADAPLPMRLRAIPVGVIRVSEKNGRPVTRFKLTALDEGTGLVVESRSIESPGGLCNVLSASNMSKMAPMILHVLADQRLPISVQFPRPLGEQRIIDVVLQPETEDRLVIEVSGYSAAAVEQVFLLYPAALGSTWRVDELFVAARARRKADRQWSLSCPGGKYVLCAKTALYDVCRLINVESIPMKVSVDMDDSCLVWSPSAAEGDLGELRGLRIDEASTGRRVEVALVDREGNFRVGGIRPGALRAAGLLKSETGELQWSGSKQITCARGESRRVGFSPVTRLVEGLRLLVRGEEKLTGWRVRVLGATSGGWSDVGVNGELPRVTPGARLEITGSDAEWTVVVPRDAARGDVLFLGGMGEGHRTVLLDRRGAPVALTPVWITTEDAEDGSARLQTDARGALEVPVLNPRRPHRLGIGRPGGYVQIEFTRAPNELLQSVVTLPDVNGDLGELVQLAGRIIGPDGKAIDKASVAVGTLQEVPQGLLLVIRALGSAMTDAEGRFSVKVPSGERLRIQVGYLGASGELRMHEQEVAPGVEALVVAR